MLYAGDLGIYGNCVLLDHGLGLASLYGHLVAASTSPRVSPCREGGVLGRSGATGLAGGDHLHFAILVGDTYVDPTEWWDAKWVDEKVDVAARAARRRRRSRGSDGAVGPAAARRAREALLAWYRANRRDLPWRRTRDPYAIWISETMLQQTRVETVIPYCERFLARFPTVEALADAPSRRRARRAGPASATTRARATSSARRAEVVARYGGRAARRIRRRCATLPGVGRYTAGAVASIAFDRPAPIVDGNVARVLARLLGIARRRRERRGQGAALERSRSSSRAAPRPAT